MGNQNSKREDNSESSHDHIQILKWRANAQYNPHIARTFLLSKAQARSRAFQKVITNQLTKQAFIDLRKLQQRSALSQSSAGEEQILVFEDYVGSLLLVEGWLEMEENLYVLITLLFGYEQIFKKLGYACVDERCCHLTPKGEVRAWIHSNPTSCVPDLQLVKESDQKRLTGEGKHRRVHCRTEASICKNILAMAHRLSDQKEPFLLFNREISNFVKSNMLQNLNFNSIRTFINGFAFHNRLTIRSDIANAIRKAQASSNSQSQMRGSSLSTLRFKKCHHKSHLSQQFSLKSGKIERPIEEDHSSSNLDQRVSELHFERSQLSHLQPQQAMTASKKSLKHMNKSIQTSQIMHQQDDHLCNSTQMHNPKKSNYKSANNQLICSEIIVTKEMDTQGRENKAKKSRLYNLEKENVAKLSKRMNIDEGQCDNQSVIIKPRATNFKKLVRFHSHNPSFDGDDYNSVHLHTGIPEKSEDHCTHHSLTHTKNNLQTKHESIFAQSPLNRSEFSHSQASNRDGQSGALTRVVSGLISNQQIDLCESVGSFQSLQNGSNSGYSGILLGMGRSVVIANDSSKRGSNNNWRGISQHVGAHMTL